MMIAEAVSYVVNKILVSPVRSAILSKRDSALWLSLTLILAMLLCPLGSQAQQDFVYVNNQTFANSVSAFSVSPVGALTQVPGSPFLTGGNGADVLCGGLDRIIISPSNNFLFVTNTSDQTISSFSIDPVTGALTVAPGSPYVTDLSFDGCQGMSIAVTPNGQFLMAASNGTIATFAVAVDGSLSASATTANSASPTSSLKISPNGKFLAVQNEVSISIFNIDAASGALTEVVGSPFPTTGPARGSSLDFNCASDHLYGAEAIGQTAIADAWSVGADGSLAPIAGSPFVTPGTDSNSLVLTPDNTLLFESNSTSNSINSFSINPDGSLTSTNVLSGVGFSHAPFGLATSKDGSLLYAADDLFGLSVFTNNLGGALIGKFNLGLINPGQIQGLAAYPAKSCTPTDLAISMTAEPATVTAGSNVTYTITAVNNGPNAASFTVADNLPTVLTFVSCAPTGGVCDKGTGRKRAITFSNLASGQSGQVVLAAVTDTTLLNGEVVSNSASIINATTIDPVPANNAQAAQVTISAPAAATTLTVSNVVAKYFSVVTLGAKLTQAAPKNPINGRTLTFSVNGIALGSAVTDAAGLATISYDLGTTLPGTYLGAVSVSFDGDTVFGAVSSTGSLTVNQAVLTVTASNATKVYGTLNPAFAYTLSGFVNNDTAAVVLGAASCSSNASELTGAGTNLITCLQNTLQAFNYSFVFVKGTLTITPAPLALVGVSVSRLYGDLNPAINGTMVGLLNGDAATASFTVDAVQASSVGDYPIIGTITPGKSFKLANYNVVTSGTLSILPSQITAIADPATRLYGDANPALTGTISGAKNGDVITATFSSAATLSSPVGSYPIVAALSGVNAGNYTASTSGALTVTPVALTVTAANATRVVGAANPAFTGVIAGLKNGDNITATYTSAADANSPAGTYPIVPAFVDPNGKLGNYSATIKNGTLTVIGKPVVVSVTPSTGSGNNQLFQLAYSDPSGFGAITQTQTIISAVQSYGAGCAVSYTASTGSIQLKDDSGLNWSAAAILGTPGVLQNSQCSIDAGASSTVGVGNNLTLSYAVTFKPTYAGTKNIYMYAANKSGLNSGWQVRGTWTLASTPSIVSVTPSAGSGSTQVFQLKYSDTGGFAAISQTQTILSAVQSYVKGCAVLYTASTQSIQLKDDAGVNWSAAAKLGVPGVLENSQCSIDIGTSSTVGAGNNLTLNYAVTFKPAYAGAKNVYMYAVNKFGFNTGWSPRGTWTVPGGAPSVLSVTPNVGTGATQLFRLSYSDPAGFAAISTTQTIISSVRSYVNGCAVLYTASTGSIQLRDDANVTWGAAAKLGVAGVLQNSQCSIDLGTSSAVGAGTNLTLSLAVTFNPAYVGTKNIYSYAANKFALNSGWQTLGTWLP